MAENFQDTMTSRRELIHEIEQRKEVEEQLSQLNSELEQRVIERTMVLKDTKEAAEAANKAKGIFIANMSHEFRTPLNAVLGFSEEMLEDQTLSSKHRDYLSIINHNGLLQLSLINDVLAMSDLENGLTTLSTEAFELSKLAENVVDKGLFASRAKNIDFKVDYQSKLPQFIRADYEKLHLIISTVINNAIKYTESGGVSLHLCCESSESNDEVKLNVNVEDTGIGITKAFQKHIFEPFVQWDQQSNKTGTGLGLALAKRFTQLMGGEMSLESELDRGTIFHIHLPVKLAAAAGFESKELPKRDIIKLSDSNNIDLQFTAKELKMLSDETLSELVDAVFSLDVENVMAINRRIEKQTPGLAGILAALVHNLDFKTLQKLLKEYQGN
ncbi:MAG: hypothetical protein KZQ67_14505 [gamma proteobacterium symbiont of Bathyaustriella thionipta]|nr:hypothetical protein [gamma proteobacterium symbiont of Bathyaustriella thionipta]